MKRSLRLAHAEEDVLDSGRKRRVEDRKIVRISAVILLFILVTSMATFARAIVAEPSAEPNNYENINIQVYILKHDIIPGQSGWLDVADVTVELYYLKPGETTWTYAGHTAIVKDKNEHIYESLTTPGWFDWSYTAVWIPIGIEVYDDDGLLGKYHLSVAPERTVNIEYNCITGKWRGDTDNHMSHGDDGTIYFAIFPHSTKLSIKVDPVRVYPGESATISGSLTTDWDGLIPGLNEIILKLWNFGGKNIILMDTTDNVRIGTVKTDPDGYYSIIYTLSTDASKGPHVIEAKFEGGDNWVGTSVHTLTNPLFVIPELPVGTAMALLSTLVALTLYKKIGNQGSVKSADPRN